jgi:D-alanine--D-alanine ligase
MTSAPDRSSTGDDERLQFVVLFGGQSAEHDVSCVTAAHVLAAADPMRYDITAIGIDRDGGWHLAEGAMAALRAGETLPASLAATGPLTSATPLISDVVARGRTVVLPLLHGPLGEDGTVQGLLELLDVPYVGSGVLGSAVAMDKGVAKQVLAHHGIPQARWRTLRDDEVRPAVLDQVMAELGLPLFVKPANMGSSVGVSKAKTPDDVADAVALALTYDEWVIVEEAIVGREIEVAVLGNQHPEASVAGEIVPGQEFYSYDDKYVDDGAQLLVPAPLLRDEADAVRSLALRAFAALRCDGLARVDFFYETDTPDRPGRGWLCNEVNTMPGFTPISMYPKLWQASGLAYGELIDRLVTLALARHARRRRNTDR